MTEAARFSRLLVTIALVAALVAWIAPFDLAFTAASGGSVTGRMVLIAALAVCGGIASRAAGLRLEGHGAGAPVVIGLAAAAAMAAWVLLLDCVLFRNRLPAGYVDFLRTPLHVRMFYFMLRAFNENVLYRLFAFGSLVWLAGKCRRGRPLPMAALLVLGALAQTVNIGINVVWYAGGTPTPAVLVYDSLRFVLPGVVCAWLFARSGFLTTEVASVGCHLFLQPGFTLLLGR